MQNSSWRGVTSQQLPLDGETHSEPLQFGSEPSLTKVSLFGGDSSFNMITDEPSFHPSTSPLPLEIQESMHHDDILNGDDDQKTPLPENNTHEQQHHFLEPHQRPTTTQSLFPDQESLFDQESRLELQFEVLSMADANIHSDNNSTSLNNKSSSRNDYKLDSGSYHAVNITNGNNHINNNNTAESQKERSATLTLKEQEKTIDTLKKDNFGLKLKIYYLEKRLDDISPDQVDNALKENVDLKVTIQTLTQELKRYKKMILDLQETMDLLHRSNQTCPLPHGMSNEEQEEYETALSNAAQYQEENKRLHKMIAELNAENTKLRVRSSQTSSPMRISRSNSNGSSSRHNNSHHEDESDFWVNHRRLQPNNNSNGNGNNKDEVDMYRKEWLQAKQTIERQNQTIQLLREENELNSASGGTRSPARFNTNESLVRSILSDRDAYVSKADHYLKSNQELQENLGRMQERNSEVMTQLINKNKELDKMHENMDDLVRSLHDAKQKLRNKSAECQKLQQQLDLLQDRNRVKSSVNVAELLETVEKLRQEHLDRTKLVEKLKAELEDRDYVHQNEIAKLDAEIERREQEFMAMEAQVVKVTNGAEKLEAHDKEKDKIIKELERRLHERSSEEGDYDEDFERLEEELRLKDEQIAKYEQRLEEVETHETDLTDLEERFMQVEQTMQYKDDQIKELEEELELMLQKTQEANQRYEEDLQILERQFQEVEQAMRERDVRIASLEGHLEAQTDAIQREKGLHHEEIKELEDKLREMANLLREKNMLMASLESQIEHRAAGAQDAAQAYEHDLADMKEQLGSRMIEAEEEWQTKLTDLEEQLKATTDQLKKDRRLANEKLTEVVNAKRFLQQKLESANKKNGLLNDLLAQYQRSQESKHGSARSTQAQQALTKLNQELQNEIQDRERALQRESARLQECELDCARLQEELEQVEQEKHHLNDLLTRRNSMITRLFERLETTNERKAVMESVLLRQATEEMIDSSQFDKRADSAMSSQR
ncbi:hypothetical protein BDA99DRAFT_557216 [Phascolomyces articulosus]|uniref:Centrosomin N-terminal motif 1 domain-containing protein n=1 Tax=Phascolomyces articulosus TaxID=60185 RepID=A0AAD5K5M0_9FUNG|nr:hypothetical protein BDA99DRAFT_557216 [Phascolomyces articulosus]